MQILCVRKSGWQVLAHDAKTCLFCLPFRGFALSLSRIRWRIGSCRKGSPSDVKKKHDVIMGKKLQIHNSTAEFLIFQMENKEEGIEVMYQDETLWLTQDAIACLFDKGRSTVAEHLQNIFQTQELQEEEVCRKFRRTAADGNKISEQIL